MAEKPMAEKIGAGNEAPPAEFQDPAVPAAIGAAEGKVEKPGIGRKVLRGSVFELLGYAFGQLLRLASNLILTRLLFPEAFGLAALIAIFNQGLVMLSDVGIVQVVVQSERGDDVLFLNTAWSVQAVRGVVLWVLSCGLAWPISALYGEPQLLQLLPVGALNVLVGGFASTSLFSLRRKLYLGRLQVIDVVSQLAGLLVVVPWAYVWPSAWAIVAGGLSTAITRTLMSHLVDVGYKNKFAWDLESRKAILGFGKWIFASSSLFFVSRQGDRLLLGRFMGVGTLGVYSIAVYLSESVGAAVARVTNGVFYPIFSQVRRDTPEKLREVYYSTRLRLDALAMTSMGALAMLAQLVVDVLTDARYTEAGWMLQALCVRVAMTCILVPTEICLYSMGHVRFGFFQNASRSLWILAGVPLGYAVGGLTGVVWATALSEVPVMLTLWPPFRRMGMLRLEREALALGFFAVGAGVGEGLSLVAKVVLNHLGIVL